MKASTRSAVARRTERPRNCEATKSGSPSASIPKRLTHTPWRARQAATIRLKRSSEVMLVGGSIVFMQANIRESFLFDNSFT